MLSTWAKGAIASGAGLLVMNAYSRCRKINANEINALELPTLGKESQGLATDTKIKFKESFDISWNKFDTLMTQKIEEITADLKKKLMNEDLWEAFETIGYLIDNVKKVDSNDEKYGTSAVLLLAVLKKAQDMIKHNGNQKNTEVGTSNKNITHQLYQGKIYGKYALDVYDASWETFKEDIAKEMRTTPDNILFTKFTDDDKLCPKFILLLDHEVKSVVLAVRGTFSIQDAVIDMVCDEVPYLDGYTHKGILSSAEKVWTEVGDIVIKALEDHPEYGLVLTGHSLGAGVAELITLDLLLGDKSSLLPAGTDVSCVALAPPPVFRTNKLDSFHREVFDKISIYIVGEDCIPRMSLGTLARLLFSIRAIDGLGLTVTEVVNIISGKEDKVNKENTEKVIQAVENVNQDHFPVLHHPGNILHFKRENISDQGCNPFTVLVEQSDTFTGWLYLNEKMVTDHRKTSYEQALCIL